MALRHVTAGLLIALPVCACVGMFGSNLVASALTMKVSIALSSLVALYFVVATWSPPNAFFPKWRSNAELPPVLRSSWRIPVFAALMFGMSYLTLSACLPWLYTALFGSVGEEQFVVSGWQNRSLRNCARPEIEGQVAFTRSFCVHQSEKNRLLPGTQIRVVGKKSIWGILTAQMYVEPAPKKTMDPTR